MTAPTTGREDVTLNGVSLDSLCYGLEDTSGLFTVPARRGSNVVVPGRHGAITIPNKHFDEADYVLPLWIAGSRPDGTIPRGSSEAREFWARRDELLRILYAATLRVEFTRPTGHRVYAVCEVTDTIDFTRRGVDPLGVIKVGLVNTGAFWADTAPVTQLIEGRSGSRHELTEFRGATAPMTELTITFQGPINNPMIELGTTTVQFGATVTAEQQLVLNTANWSVSPGTGASWAPDLRQIEFTPGPEWFAISPSATPFEVRFTHTGGGEATCAIAGRRKYLAP